MNRFYEKLNVPKNCIVDNTVFKKAFLENVDLLSLDKKIINEHIKKVTWKYCLKPDTINIQPYRSDERDYLEIEIMEVQLNEDSKVKRIAESIMRAIPYPILLVLVKDNQIQLVTGDMRKNLSDSSKVTVEDFSFTGWIDLNSEDIFRDNLFAELNISKLSYINFYEMYKDITAKVNLYNVSKIKGSLVNTENTSNFDTQEIYTKIKSLEDKIAQLQNKVKKAIDVAERVEISVELNKLRKEKESLLKLL